MKKMGVLLSIVIMLGVTPVLFAQSAARYTRLEMHKEGAAAQRNYVERKIANAQAEQAKKEAAQKAAQAKKEAAEKARQEAVSKEIRQASDELLNLTFSGAATPSESKFLDAMW